ncbi:bacteriohemerythrin [Magnetovibrio blakemorei]|nr:bacteriohemerythrin [Magnetovibrio blakemorei]
MSLRFSSLVILILLPGLALMLGALFFIGQRSFEHVIDMQTIRDFEHTRTLMALMVDDRLQSGAQEMDSSVRSSNITAAVENDNKADVRKILNQILESRSGNLFDRLVVEREADHTWTSVDMSFNSSAHWSPRPRTETCGSWNHQLQKLNGITWHSLVYCTEIVSQISGRVLGRLHGGLVLNENIPLLLDIGHAIGVDNLALRDGNEIISALSHFSSDGTVKTISQHPSLTIKRQNENVFASFPFAHPSPGTRSWQTSLEVVAVKQAPQFGQMVDALMKDAYWAALAVLILGGVTTLILHRAIGSSLGKLMQYVEAVRVGQHKSRAPSSTIAEVNELGFVLDDMVRTLRQSEQSLILTKDEAEKASKAKSEFLASMSHELRTPLNAVLGFAQMLQYDPQYPLSDLQNERVEYILSGGHHLLSLIDEILELAKIEAHQLTISLDEVSAREVIVECVSLATSLSLQHEISIINNTFTNLDATLLTDRIRFKQVLVNLLSNAIKFNSPGGTVTIDAEETPNGFLRLSVSDSGIGIAEADRDKVFQLFHRLGADPAIAREGTGIGLTITKTILDHMAGSINFISKLGQGTTFWIELPLSSNNNVLIWSEAMITGVEAIDKDHRVLMKLLNKITRDTVGRTDIGDIVDKLVDYTHFHFKREETIMEVCAYPGLEEHRAIHKSIAAKVDQLAIKWREKPEPELLAHLHKFLRDWLFSHIILEDTKIEGLAKGKKREIKHALDMLSSVEGNNLDVLNND